MSLLTLKFIDLQEPPITLEHLDQFESSYDIFVPEELKQLFLRMNRCMLEYPIIECDQIDGGLMPETWAGVAQNGMNYLLDFFGASLGDNVLPFCRDPGGNIFTVKMNGRHQGGIYYVNLDEPNTEFGSRQYQSYWLANDLDDFASRITFSSN